MHHLTLKRPPLAVAKAKWLSAPSVLLLTGWLLGLMCGHNWQWLLFYLVTSPVCLVCSSLVLAHAVVATGSALFRITMLPLNLVGLAVALVTLVIAACAFMCGST